MANSTHQSLAVLMRIGRMIQRFEWCGWQSEIHGYADSNWTGDKSNYKSTSGGALMWSPHAIKMRATSQSTVALISGEAELCAITKAAVQMQGVMSLAADFEIDLEGIAHSESYATIGIVHREGLGEDSGTSMSSICGLKSECKNDTSDYAKCLARKTRRHDDEDSWPRDNTATLEVYEFQVHSWRSSKKFQHILKSITPSFKELPVVCVCGGG